MIEYNSFGNYLSISFNLFILFKYFFITHLSISYSFLDTQYPVSYGNIKCPDEYKDAGTIVGHWG